ncbi:hypothetical protein [Streptomyces sp. NPDC049949]|uniref:hypothetical protein n=1 Tax=Streptomyces sp. NPDC049949 TaxID=3154627 RepID=UPI00342A1448
MMITTRSAAAVAAAFALTLSLPMAAHAAGQSAAPAPAAAVPQVLPIGVAVSALAVEDRNGYQRTSFKHWNAGDVPADGCNTRQEVLLAEAVVYPEVGPDSTLTGGTWWSYSDEREVTPAGALDIDHMVSAATTGNDGITTR